MAEQDTAEQNSTPTRRLAGPVTVGARTYQPDDYLPPEVAAQIRNPKAWAVDEAEAKAEADRPKTGGTTSGARLSGHVTVGGKTWRPDEPLPDDVAAQIRNPKAWEGGKLPDQADGSAEKTAESDPGEEDAPPAPPAPADFEPAPEPAGDGEQKGRRSGARRT
jgi:hypothetical protein